MKKEKLIHEAPFGKTNLKTINNLKKAYNEKEVEILLREVKENIVKLKEIKDESYYVKKIPSGEYEYIDYDYEESYYLDDPHSIKDAIIGSLTLINKGTKLGLTNELLELVQEVIKFQVDITYDDSGDIEEAGLELFTREFELDKLFDITLKNIYFILYASLLPIEACKEILTFIEKQELTIASLKDFLYENKDKLRDLDGFIEAFCLIYEFKERNSSRLQTIYYIEDVFDILDLVTNRNRIKEKLYNLSKNEILFLVYLTQNFGLEERYFLDALTYLESDAINLEIKQTLVNLILPELNEVKNEDLKYRFVKASFLNLPNLKTYRYFLLLERKETKDIINEGVNATSIYDSRNHYASLGYIFLLLLNKKEEFFNYLSDKKYQRTITINFIKILVNLVVKGETDLLVVEKIKSTPFKDKKFSCPYLSNFIDENDAIEMKEYLTNNITFTKEEVKKIYEFINEYTSSFVETSITKQNRGTYDEGALLIHLVDELNVYINNSYPNVIVNMYLTKYQRYRSLIKKINEI